MPLILPRNPLAYPGIKAGFNLAHPASGPGLRYSGIASNGSFINLLTGAAATVVGTITAGLEGHIGPTIVNITSGAYLSAPGKTDPAATGITYGAVLFLTSNSPGTSVIFGSDGNTLGNSGPAFLVGNTTQPQLWWSGGQNFSSFNLALNIPYFIAVSVLGGKVAWVIVNLATGGKWTNPPNAIGASSSTSHTQYVIGGNSDGNRQLNGKLAAVMFSMGGVSFPQLLAWARAPWDFWYPPAAGSLIFSGAKGAAAAAAAPRVMVMA